MYLKYVAEGLTSLSFVEAKVTAYDTKSKVTA
jgi:hypothetical protein